jgi:short-subunit dehydrogenase
MATALVTGGTSGIGAAFARALAARGDDLVLVARSAERLAETAAEISDRHGVTVEVIAADLGIRDDVLRVADRITRSEQPIDLLVNNAGFGLRMRLTAADTSPHEHAMDVMCRAVLILAAAAGRVMRERGHGVIINVSSTAGFLAMGGYSAIKAWVTAYSEALANELRGSGVTVTALCPGWVRTEFHERANIHVSRIPGLLWVDADRLVADCLVDVDRRKVISIPSRRYKVLIFLARHAPRGLVRTVSALLSSGRHSE